jgi:hypothetical protein
MYSLYVSYIPEKTDSKEEGLILAHRGFHPSGWGGCGEIV